MKQDSVRYDSLENRPLPKWLRDQKEGLNTTQPARIIIKEDKALDISFTATAIIIVLIVVILTSMVLKKKMNNYK